MAKRWSGFLIYLYEVDTINDMSTPEKDAAMPDPITDQPALTGLTDLIKNLNSRENNIHKRQANIDAIIDQDFFDLQDVFKKLAQ